MNCPRCKSNHTLPKNYKLMKCLDCKFEWSTPKRQGKMLGMGCKEVRPRGLTTQ